MSFLNVSFYSFSSIQDPNSLSAALKKEMEPLPLKGTIILAKEGINGFLAGEGPILKDALQYLQTTLDLKNFWAKESQSDQIPFEKLCFKVKEEIVTFRVPDFSLENHPAPQLKPQDLADWYEKGEDFLLLDTRNEYEVRLGTFDGAKSLNIDHFVDFPKAMEQLDSHWKTKKIVTFCTGGIRCEKAAPFLRSKGYEAYQLEGGILNYFEKVGAQHWQGECFVFDNRIALSPKLEATGATLCNYCQGPNPKDASFCMHCQK
jgi:UPF0176 protein